MGHKHMGWGCGHISNT